MFFKTLGILVFIITAVLTEGGAPNEGGLQGCPDGDCRAQMTILREMLRYAVAVEQGVIQPYLSALYSIHVGTNKDASKVLHDVVLEEMSHMACAANVLNAIGGHPNLDGSGIIPKYPMRIQYLNATTSLAPFSVDQITQFMKIEEAHWGPDKPAHTIGVWYDKILEIMGELVSKYGEAAVFIGDPRLQLHVTMGETFKVPPVYSYLDAKAVLEGVLYEGGGYDDRFWVDKPYNKEDTPPGYPSGKEHPHYYRFEEILRGHFYSPSDKPHPSKPTGPALDTNWSAVYKFLPDPKAADYKNHTDIYSNMMQFNSCYSALLDGFHKTFNGSPETFFALMPTMMMITRLAGELMSTPAPGHPGYTVGTPWEWVNITDPSVPACPSLMRNDDVIV